MSSTLKGLLVIVWAAGLALACQTQEQATEQGTETSPAIDESAVRETIAAKDQAWGAAAVAGDVESLVQQYTSDATLMPPGAPRAEGAEAIRQAFTGWLGEAPPASATVVSDEITIAAAGDYAHAVGTWTMSGTMPDGSEYSDNGKFLAVWQSVDGDWKIATDIWNSDNPPPGMESAPAEEPEPAPAE
ncbi:MAG TPA: DUF4440 domain-containing protein [Gemmatimonadota bacterium]|nr:DUF4440 domain-containing protein [Gemmatimonadota bacterium]